MGIILAMPYAILAGSIPAKENGHLYGVVQFVHHLPGDHSMGCLADRSSTNSINNAIYAIVMSADLHVLCSHLCAVCAGEKG